MLTLEYMLKVNRLMEQTTSEYPGARCYNPSSSKTKWKPLNVKLDYEEDFKTGDVRIIRK